jgi:hypothetical protein
MALVLLALLVVLLLFGAGFALHLLWIVALVALALWVIGWLIGAAEGGVAAGSRRRWYGR